MGRKTSLFLIQKNLRNNPFVGAPRLGAEPTSDELNTGQRVIRNQILTRAAPSAGRALIAIGTTAVAASTASGRTRRAKRFSVVDRKTAKKTGTLRKDTVNYRRASVFRRTPEIGVQERRVYKRNARAPSSTRALKTGGTALIIGGKALPTLAYGYIGYDLYRRRAGPKEIHDTVHQTTFGVTIEEQQSALVDIYSGTVMAMHVVNSTPLRHLNPFS